MTTLSRMPAITGASPEALPEKSSDGVRPAAGMLVLVLAMSLSACTQNNDDDGVPGVPVNSPTTPTTEPGTDPSTGVAADDFSVQASTASVELQEGEPSGASVSITLTRDAGFNAPVNLSIEPAATVLGSGIEATLSNPTLAAGDSDSELALSLGIGTLPRLSQELDLVITASSGAMQATATLQVNIVPVDAPDVYLLVGQSNMVGFSGDRTRQSGPGQPDAPNPRIKQLHVTANERETAFVEPSDYTSTASNIITSQPLIDALDPLHLPLGLDGTGKDDAYIGPGLSFAKAALPNTDQNIVLVPAAWSSTSFCRDVPEPVTGQLGGWNAVEPDSSALGDTLLFDRALTRVNAALETTGGVLRGILWHQGETDSNERCAPLYEDNLRLLISEMRDRIDVDAAGAAFRGPDAPVPFIIGTMSRGADERGDLSVFAPEKQTIDDAHRLLAAEVPFSGLANLDDLVPPEYPCGNTTCIHFGPEAQRLAGQRYYEALQRAVQ